MRTLRMIGLVTIRISLVFTTTRVLGISPLTMQQPLSEASCDPPETNYRLCRTPTGFQASLISNSRRSIYIISWNGNLYLKIEVL
ncbi:hypothetical protein BGZ61DRAFT_469583 [Ilyonectria robusta]|uniref:uncharacterized protein n=1 Tax=Ilyonectria robusta TaxID=1079257 RepID=UPI001E8EBFC0|nr:uncharacterized protein BGZ61DRAFT_469583 [Ilyonectria robusta]KAH8649530.1 hypothetical protein BGZ61DRAFT_469583 [Ilyonectria robusta]